MNKTVRQSNLELLRIISMIFIVMSHCDEIFGLSTLYSGTLGINKIITDWLHIGGQIGVGCFLLISGYFMVEQEITPKKIFKVVGEVWFFTIGIWLIWVIYLMIKGEFELIDIFINTVYSFFPILFSHYWFVTAYIILMLISPFFNVFIKSMDKTMYSRFLFVIIMIFVVLAGGFPGVLSGMIGGRIVPVFVVYFIAGYIRKFVDKNKKNALRHIFISFVFYLLLFTSFYLITYIGVISGKDAIKQYCYYYRVLNSPLVMIICIELFIGFIKINVKYNKVINYLAGSTFGVYLIHQNRIVATKVLPYLFPIYKESNSFLIFVYSVLGVLVIYGGCMLIDILRRNTFEPIWNKYLNGKFEDHLKKVNKLIRDISNTCVRLLMRYYN